MWEQWRVVVNVNDGDDEILHSFQRARVLDVQENAQLLLAGRAIPVHPLCHGQGARGGVDPEETAVWS